MRPWWGSIGFPPDAVSWCALAVAVALAAALRKDSFAVFRRQLSVRWAVAVLAATAALLSEGYIIHYLRGGPRIVDATSYWLQARSFAQGAFTFEVPTPTAAFRGRFLLPTQGGERLGVIFPPGYPLLLAAGFLARAPLAVGPLLAAALVVVTYAMTKRLLGRTDVAVVAAALSMLSATLRYHTADTMSHALSALLFALAVTFAFEGPPRRAVVAGLCTGWLVATRPVTGALSALLCGLLLVRSPKAALAFALGCLPGVALFVAHQRALTGTWFESAQYTYYLLSDGPPGCFRYGFGPEIGCLVEHGDFVRARLTNGFGLVEAAATTFRRLYWHLADAANLELTWLLVPAAAILGRNMRGIRYLLLAIAGVMVAYVPFYFEGSYPGGGARLFVDALPFEHALMASALVRLRLERAIAPLALAGFALHTSFDHQRLAMREGGAPMLEPRVLRDSGIERGLVFVSTDHGFNLGHVPGQLDASRAIVVARLRRDAHDAVLWDRLGRPTSYVYEFDTTPAAAGARVRPYTPMLPRSLRFEAEAEWPPLAISGGWAHVAFPPQACTSGRRALRLRSAGGSSAVSVELAVPSPGTYAVTLGTIASEGDFDLTARVGTESFSAHVPRNEACLALPLGQTRLTGSELFTVEANAPGMLLDYVELVRISGD
jgi:hypothetical protein